MCNAFFSLNIHLVQVVYCVFFLVSCRGYLEFGAQQFDAHGAHTPMMIAVTSAKSAGNLETTLLSGPLQEHMIWI